MPQSDTPHILLVNPWIHDFAAYDFWAQPLGLLTIGAILRAHGMRIRYVDCLDRFHPRAPSIDDRRRSGRGAYLKTPLAKPPGLEDVPRQYSCYGIRPEWLAEDLARGPRPDLILVTSMMTYWYPGLRATIDMLRQAFGSTPIVLGGIYATLCRPHAIRHSGADEIFAGPAEEEILALIGRLTGFHVQPSFDPADLDSYPYPAFDQLTHRAYVPLLTSKGCPFKCEYCAAHLLHPRCLRRSPQAVVEEIRHWHHAHGVSDFAFYDDALLVGASQHALPLLEKIVQADLKVRLHTPNALHVREISEKVADLMFRAGFDTVRLGLETADFDSEDRLDDKVNAGEFAAAVQHLRSAGFTRNQLGAYLLVGLPDQNLADVKRSILKVRASGIQPILAYFTPIPHTAIWQRAVAASRYDLAADPIFTNNAVFPCWEEGFSWETTNRLKRWVAGQ